MPRLRLADGVDPAVAGWPDLGYAGAYLASYQTFVALREQGVIPPGVRFQVEYPTPPWRAAFALVPYHPAEQAPRTRTGPRQLHQSTTVTAGCRSRRPGQAKTIAVATATAAPAR